jgi:hypothetical protein
MEAAGLRKTSVTIYKSAWLHIPEDLNLYHHYYENHKSHMWVDIQKFPLSDYMKMQSAFRGLVYETRWKNRQTDKYDNTNRYIFATCFCEYIRK